MKVENLRSLIRESINEYIREIDNAGTKAGLEAKIAATEGAIAKREKMANMEGIDEAYHEMLDKGKMKEISNEVKALKKSLNKLQNQLSKLNSKSEPKAEVKDEVIDEDNMPKAQKARSIGKSDNWNDDQRGFSWNTDWIEDDRNIGEARFKKGTDIGKKGKGFNKIAKAAGEKYGSEEAGKRVAGAVLKKVLNKENEETAINESFLKMQKLAGVITEGQYKEKLNEAPLFLFPDEEMKKGASSNKDAKNNWNVPHNTAGTAPKKEDPNIKAIVARLKPLVTQLKSNDTTVEFVDLIETLVALIQSTNNNSLADNEVIMGLNKILADKRKAMATKK